MTMTTALDSLLLVVVHDPFLRVELVDFAKPPKLLG